MPYTSDAERERARWMTFEEAIAFVSQADDCGGDCAEQQLRDALSDRKLFIRWEWAGQAPWAMPRHRQPTGHGGSEAGPTPILDRPPDDPLFWQQTPIRKGMVFDPFTQRERRLLLLRLSVQQIWPSRTTVPLLRGKAGRKGYRDKIEEKLTGVEPMTLADATRHLRGAWSDNDGPLPCDATIRRHLRKIRGRQNPTTS